MSKIYVDEIAPKTSGGSVTSATNIVTPTRPAFCASGSSGAWAGLSTGNIVAFDDATSTGSTQIVFNKGGHYNTSTYGFTCPVDGLYFFGFNIYTGGNGDTVNSFTLGKNGYYVTTGAGENAIGHYGTAYSAETGMCATYTLDLSAGDVIDVRAATGSQIYYGHSWFHGYLIG